MSENKTNEAIQKELEKLKAENAALAKELEKSRKDAEALAKEQSARMDEQVAKQEEKIARQLRMQRKVRIVIASGRGSHERCPVPVAINGREFLIERDKEVDVPQGVLNVLDLAVANVAETQDTGGQANTVFHKAQRYAYRVLGYVDPKTGELTRV